MGHGTRTSMLEQLGGSCAGGERRRGGRRVRTSESRGEGSARQLSVCVCVCVCVGGGRGGDLEAGEDSLVDGPCEVVHDVLALLVLRKTEICQR
eukprot:2966094-Rhodomonas_salina.2